MENEIIIGGELKMKLSKIVKKITSISLAAALAVSGINYQPAKAEAAELPVVTVLGATLSLDADAGKQSMRVAIKVENADNASACGMSITYNGKKLDFSTNDDRYNKLYDVDADSGAIVYTVKIANIPKANFGDDFTIEGYATPIAGGSGEDVKTEAPVEKSVQEVADAIMAKDATIKMSEVTGTLMRKVIGLDIAENTEIYAKDSQNQISCWYNDADADAAYEYVAGDDCFKITTDSSTGKGIGYQCSNGGAGKYIYSMDIKTADTVKTKVVGYFGSYGGTGNTEWTGTGDWMSVEQAVSLDNYGAAYLSTNSGAADIYVKRFEVYKAITNDDVEDTKLTLKSQQLDLSTLKTTDGSSFVQNNDGSLTITTAGNYTGGIKIAVPKLKVANPTKLQIAIEAIEGSGGQFVVKFDDGTDVTVYNWDGGNISNYGDSTTTFEGKVPVEIILNNQESGTVWILKSITIE